ncbi:MAG: hypothetical protein JWN78_421 [Bacteroidota bacterium]|nr:hypothetical protein [Bacteroidota bacterium]
MTQLPKFTLSYNSSKNQWELKNDATDKIIAIFNTKTEATKTGVLDKAVGNYGSVKIKLENGRFEEERTYPRSADPKSSQG